jgi:two-component system nitrate/nitrite response regulator NarL
MNSVKTFSIILADDHQLVRKGLVQLIQDFDIVSEVREAANGSEVIQLLENKKSDLIILDIDMPVMGGIECAAIVKQKYPKAKTIMLTMQNHSKVIKQVMAIGAAGYVFKNATEEELYNAIATVGKGEVFISKDATQTLLSQEETYNHNFENKLTPREIEIIKMVARGMSSKDIGDKICISPRTVDTHRNNILHKLQLPNLQALILFAVQNGLVQ